MLIPMDLVLLCVTVSLFAAAMNAPDSRDRPDLSRSQM